MQLRQNENQRLIVCTILRRKLKSNHVVKKEIATFLIQ